MEKVKEDILFHESGLNKGFYTNFNQYTSNINNFRGSLIVFSGGLITFLIFFTKDIQNLGILEFCIIFSLIIVFNLSVLIGVVFPILHLKINLYRNYLYIDFISIVKKCKIKMNFNPEKFNKIDIDKYKKETLNFQYKNNNLPWYFNAFIILENTFIIIFIVFLIILLISLSIYYI